MKVFDVLLDDTLDLLIENDDFVIGESTAQHIEVILFSEKGNIRHAPLLGVNIDVLIHDDGSGANEFRADTQEALERDGMKVIAIKFEDEKPTINAEYV